MIKKRPIELFEKFKKLSIGDIGISTIAVAELQYGVMKSSNPSKNQEALNKFLTPFDILDFDFNSTIEYGKIRSDLEKEGLPIGPLDYLIAAQAKGLNLTLVTNNVKEFIRVKGLRIENWIENL